MVVEKETVPVEQVRFATDTVTEQQEVNEQVRKEEIEERSGWWRRRAARLQPVRGQPPGRVRVAAQCEHVGGPGLARPRGAAF